MPNTFYYYLVYIPSLTVIFSSIEGEEVEAKWADIGHDYDEDYRIMGSSEFIDLVRRVYS